VLCAKSVPHRQTIKIAKVVATRLLVRIILSPLLNQISFLTPPYMSDHSPSLTKLCRERESEMNLTEQKELFVLKFFRQAEDAILQM